MRRPPSRFRRLDGALADLPLDEPMLLTELDGFLTGLLVCVPTLPADEWMAVVWGPETGGIPPFDDPLDVQWFAAAVAARRDEIARDLDRGRLKPILDVDERDGAILWEYWMDGFAEATVLRPDDWAALANDPATAAAWSSLATLIAIADETSDLDSIAINERHDRAVDDLTVAVRQLYAAHPSAVATKPIAAAPVGRNDPCPCGSGKKHKRCCA